MKKIFVFLILFAIIALGFTAGLIKNKNGVINSISGEEIVNDFNHPIENPDAHVNEKTIDLYGTYNENDLIIDTEPYVIEEKNINWNIPHISGLKEKKVENKINTAIKEKIVKETSPIINNDEVTYLDFYYNTYFSSNFSNVISLDCNLNYKIGEEYFNKMIGLNYELINGEALQFEDLFKRGEDLNSIVRIALYKSLAENHRDMSMEGFGYDDVYYDIEKGGWYGKYSWYDVDAEMVKEEVREYVPQITEYDLEKSAKKFMNDNNKEFNFSPIQIVINIDNQYCRLFFKDIADKVVIYDKYLTKESLYERDDIGAKSFLSCSAEHNLSKYKETKFASDNFFYDIDVNNANYYGSEFNYPAKKYYELKEKEGALKINEKVAEYQKIAAANPQTAYFLIVRYDIECGSKYKNSMTIYNNLLSTKLKTKIITCDISEKKDRMDAILNNYRYYNLGMYGNVYDTINGTNFLGVYDKYKEFAVDEKVEKNVYNVLTGKEIKSIEELFKEGVDYDWVIKNVARVDLPDDVRYEFDVNNIIVNASEEEYGRYIDFNDIEEYLSIQELKSEIFPSNVRQLEESELDGLDKEELYRAYNEIFARHGHDFKMQEYNYYFNLWDWYKPISEKTVSLDELSEIERYNAKLIKSIIDAKE
ncbi:MAG: YARHG domain-containing protein [Clostridia bacterium]|nr:YARHG domain-containing protein [Clostridia bacterium]